MLVAIDFGISNTDIAVLDKDETVFYSSPSKPSKINSDYIKDILKKYPETIIAFDFIYALL